MGIRQIFLIPDQDVPACNSYKKNGCIEVSSLIPSAKYI